MSELLQQSDDMVDVELGVGVGKVDDPGAQATVIGRPVALQGLADLVLGPHRHRRVVAVAPVLAVVVADGHASCHSSSGLRSGGWLCSLCRSTMVQRPSLVVT